jgi:3-hydroxyacyl-CoA dehydrogenase
MARDGLVQGGRGVEIAASDGIACLTLSHPPVNALSRALAGDLIAALDIVLADPSTRAVVIRAAGRTWPAGADIAELAAGPATRTPEVVARIAGAPVPVVALLHGTVLGGGLEIALAATARIARPGTQLGLPEVTLGLAPGAGGTQRLPRLVGPRRALAMLLSGRPVEARAALVMGLIDAIAEAADPLPEVQALVRDLVAAGRAGASVALDPPAAAADWLAAVAAARAALPRTQTTPAPARIIDCVEAAALLPPEAAMIFERTAFEDLWATSQSAGLRHAFLAERRAARSRRLDGAAVRGIDAILVLGGGAAAAALAHAAIAAGVAVTLAAPDEAQLTAALSAVATAQERARAAGRSSAAVIEVEWARITGSVGLPQDVAGDLVLRADRQMPVPAGRPLAELSLPPVGRSGAAMLLAPGDRLAEVVAGPQATPAALAAIAGLARRIGRVAVVSGVGVDGLSPLGTLLRALGVAADHMVAHGASPYAVDRVLEAWGMAAGPFRLRDRGGPRAAAAAPRPGSLMALVAAEIGRRPVYRTGGGGIDPDRLALIAAARDAAGIAPRPWSEDEIIARVLGALANAGARLIEAEPGLKPAAIDAAMILGAGFPRWRGGPMHAADCAGILQMRNRLRDFARADEVLGATAPGADALGSGTPLWTPVPLWDRLVREGSRFGDLNT